MDENMSKSVPKKNMNQGSLEGMNQMPIEGGTPMWKSWKFWLIVVLGIVIVGGALYLWVL